MRIDFPELLAALNEEDVESLLDAGAPPDEYGSEASRIAEAASTIPEETASREDLVRIITQVWSQMFDLGVSELELRTPAFTRIAQRLLARRAT